MTSSGDWRGFQVSEATLRDPINVIDVTVSRDFEQTAVKQKSQRIPKPGYIWYSRMHSGNVLLGLVGRGTREDLNFNSNVNCAKLRGRKPQADSYGKKRELFPLVLNNKWGWWEIYSTWFL